MKYATKDDAMKARLQALARNRREQQRSKHRRWAAEMELSGWLCEPPLPQEIVDGLGTLWQLSPGRTYRTVDGRAGRTRKGIVDMHGIREERW